MTVVPDQKQCPRCGHYRQRDEFARDASKSSGFKSFCKACDRVKSRAWYERNRERKLAYMARRNAARKWALQSRYLDPSPTAGLFYEAEALTPLGTAAVGTRSGASGGGLNNVVAMADLPKAWSAILSTQGSGGGAHMTQVGTFEVLARVFMPTSNVGAVSVAFEWGQGDLRKRTMNPQVDFEAGHGREGQFVLVSLGQITVRRPSQGSHRWEGRVVAKSTGGGAGDGLEVDYLALIPITEGSGEMSAVKQYPTPTAYTARDSFDGHSGVTTGDPLPQGGTWTFLVGDADDFVVNNTGDNTLERNSNNDSHALGRIIYASSSSLSACHARLDFAHNLMTSQSVSQRLLVRSVNSSNFVVAGLTSNVSTGTVEIGLYVYIGGSIEHIDRRFLTGFASDTAWYTLAIDIDAAGRYWLWCGPRPTGAGTAPSLILAGQYATRLATGGSLATGTCGIQDIAPVGAGLRSYDNFIAFAPAADAAVFASRQLELSHNRAERQDSTGSFWNEVSRPPEDYLLLAPMGREKRGNRLIFQAARGDPDTMPHTGGGGLQVQILARPVYLSVPTPD